MAVSRRLKITLIVVASVTVFAAVAVAVGLPRLREYVRTTIERRCGSSLGGTCRVDRVELARDGIVAYGLHAVPTVGGASLDITRVAVGLNWWSAATGGSQSITARVRGVVGRTDSSVDDVVAAIRRARDARPAGTGGSARIRLDRVIVEDAALNVRLGVLFRLNVERAELDWRRSGPLGASWANATLLTGPFTTAHTGRCTLRRGTDEPRAELTCEGFGSRVDIDTAGDSASTVGNIVRVVLAAMTGRRSDATGAPVDRSVEGSSGAGLREFFANVHIVAQAGHVEFAQSERTIVEFTPARIEIEVRDGRVQTVHGRFGRNEAGTALEIELHRPRGRPWQVDVGAHRVPLAELARWVPAVPWHDVQTGRAEFRLRAEPTDEAGTISLDGEFSLEHFGLRHRRLAHDPIEGLDASVRGTMLVDLPRRRVSTEGVQFTVNGILVGLAGWAEHRRGRSAMDLALRVPTMSCDAFRRQLPATVTGPIADLRFAGNVGADVHFAIDTGRLEATELDVRIDDRCAIAHDGLAQGVARFSAPFVQRVQEPTGVRAFVTGPGSAAWVPLAEISPHVANAVMTREDGRFYRHRGFNLSEIRGAIVSNVGAGRFVYGASTITMQLAKNVFLAREKTLVRKLQEVVFTWYLERTMDKDSILELYLNVVEFGPGIYGIGPASRFFFNREPRDLTAMQAIYLATLLPNPVGRFGTYQRGRVSDEHTHRLRSIARSMAAVGRLEPQDLATAMTETLSFRLPSTRVQGALTQNVEPTTTDAMAASMVPVRNEYGEVAEDTTRAGSGGGGGGGVGGGGGRPGGDGAAVADDSDPTANPDDTTRGSDHPPERAPLPPVNLRVGGTI